MALNTILYNGKAYGDQDIEDATGYRKSALVADELPYDTFEVEVWDYASALLMLADSGPKIVMMNADGRFMLARMSNEKMTLHRRLTVNDGLGEAHRPPDSRGPFYIRHDHPNMGPPQPQGNA